MSSTHGGSPALSTWFICTIGALALIALAMLLPTPLIMAFYLVYPDVEWDKYANDASSAWWYVLHTPDFVAGLLAGAIAAKLRPRRPVVVGAFLCGVALLVRFFEQLPWHAGLGQLLVWEILPVAGVLVGFTLQARMLRRHGS